MKTCNLFIAIGEGSIILPPAIPLLPIFLVRGLGFFSAFKIFHLKQKKAVDTMLHIPLLMMTHVTQGSNLPRLPLSTWWLSKLHILFILLHHAYTYPTHHILLIHVIYTLYISLWFASIWSTVLSYKYFPIY